MKKCFLALAMFLAQVLPAFAVSDVEQSASVKSKHVFWGDVDATSAGLELTDTQFKYSFKFKLDNGLPIDLKMNVGHIDLIENDPVELPSHLESRSFLLGTKLPALFMNDDRYFIGVDLVPTFNTDGYVWESSAFRLPVRMYMAYKESDDLIVVLGVWVRPDYDRKSIPFIGFLYNPTDYFSLDFTSSNPTISYRVNEQTKIFAEMEFNWQEFEVSRNTEADVVLKYKDLSFGAGLEHHFNDRWTARVSAGAGMARRFEYEDGNGKVVPGTGPYAAIAFTGVF